MTLGRDLSFKKCFAVGCDRNIPRRLLMCPEHWHRVPCALQRDVYHTLSEWNAGGRLRPYVLATLRAQLVIAEDEDLQPAAAAIRAEIDQLQQKEKAHAATK